METFQEAVEQAATEEEGEFEIPYTNVSARALYDYQAGNYSSSLAIMSSLSFIWVVICSFWNSLKFYSSLAHLGCSEPVLQVTKLQIKNLSAYWEMDESPSLQTK